MALLASLDACSRAAESRTPAPFLSPTDVDAAAVSFAPDTLRAFSGARQTGWEVQTYSRDTIDGREALRQALQFSDENGETFDTIWVALPGLLPIRHHRTGTFSHVDLRFDSLSVRGSASMRGQAVAPVAITFAHPTWDGAAMDLVFRALPMRPGLTVTVPIYAAGGTESDVRVEVTGQDTYRTLSGGEMVAWVVQVAYGNDLSTYRFARDGRAFLEMNDPAYKVRYAR